MMRRLPLLAAAMAMVSLLAAGAAILTMYDPRAVARAMEGADLSLLGWAIVVGAAGQVLRAQRLAVMTRRHHRVSLEQAFGARVLSHAVSSVVPLGPACMGLEGLLLRRLAGLPLAYSAGVVVACGVLDHLSIIPLLTLVLLAMHLPGWMRLLLLGALLHSVLSLVLPLLAAATRSRLGRLAPRPGWRGKLLGTIRQAEDGLAVIVSGGWRIAVSAAALSLLLAAMSLLRLALLLGAFELSPSPHQLVLLVLLGGMLGSVPIQLPGASAWATGKLLRLIHVLGPGASAFVLVSSVMGVVETPLLALGLLLWWALPHSRVSMRLSELVALAQESRSERPSGADVA
ncbi:MAG: flippase-like domain-containing protein [Chloroflexi bacterium]|nr:flippase-like domain-containing protein [Chloroflexota bacterium]